MDVLRLLVKLGLQSVAAHKRKSMIVGGLMAFGAYKHLNWASIAGAALAIGALVLKYFF